MHFSVAMVLRHPPGIIFPRALRVLGCWLLAVLHHLPGPSAYIVHNESGACVAVNFVATRNSMIDIPKQSILF